MNSIFSTRISTASLALALLLPLSSLAQKSLWNTTGKTKEKAGKKIAGTQKKAKNFKEHLQNWGLDTGYNRAFLIGGKLNSDGWSGTMNYVKRRTCKTSNYWQLSFSEIRHEKQAKQKGTNAGFKTLGNPGNYHFGKINTLYTLQLGFGKEHLLLPAVIEDNLSVSFRYGGGLSLAMLKPYYLKLIYIDYSGSTETAHIEEHIYSRADSAKFLEPKTIFGNAKFGNGIEGIDYVPGGYIETALVITPRKSKTFATQITLGISAAMYYKPLPIIQGQHAHPYQVCLFAGLLIGKRR